MHVFMSKLTYEYTSNEFLVTHRKKIFRRIYVMYVLITLFPSLINLLKPSGFVINHQV
jgi:hypothetical protein